MKHRCQAIALITLFLLVSFGHFFQVRAGDIDFDTWLRELRIEARQVGISDQTLDRALTGIKILPAVISLDRNQPEFNLTLAAYLNRAVSSSRVRQGKHLLEQQGKILEFVSSRYGVQPRFLVALWGIETDFGRISGKFPVVESLVTLAVDPRRSSYFRKELICALHILDKKLIPREKMLGSWAGAIGGMQFMPSVFRKFAIDHDSDGWIDVWGNSGDLFSSGANYLASSGWHFDQTWGREVSLPEGFDRSLAGHERIMGVREWQKIGIRKIDGSDLPRRNLPASLIIPEENGDRAFLAYDNYRAFLKWNRSDYFAVAVGMLSDQLSSK